MPHATETLPHIAAQIRAKGLLGQGRALEVFDYLVRCAAEGRVPKEAQVAVEIFGKSPTADLSQDASVRVYVHNVRRKLEQFYSGPGRHEPHRLSLPKGEYRLVVTPNPTREAPGSAPESDTAPPPEPKLPPPPGPAAPPARHHSGYRWIATLLAGALLGVAGAWLVHERGREEPFAASHSAFWAPLLQDGRPVLMVLGDYYIFGDTGGELSMNVVRLIRDFTVNSNSDLQHYLISRPQEADRYQDVGLSYLPTSSAYVLANLMPLLTPIKPRLRVTLASELTPAMVKSSDLIYVGLLSGMGTLQGTAFSASRFRFGDSFDELIDSTTHQHYRSQAVNYADGHFDRTGAPTYRDYGYLSSFTGPTGNRIIVIAGMQDEGLRQTMDFLLDPSGLDELVRKTADRSDVEGLLEVSGMNHLNLSGRLVAASALAQTTVTAR